MNILDTLEKNYLPPLKTMLLSLFIKHPCDSFDVYLASDNLTEDDLGDVSNLCRRFHSALHLIHVEDEWFADAPTLRYYSRAMYYRLLAAQLLPEGLDRMDGSSQLYDGLTFQAGYTGHHRAGKSHPSSGP